ncbi:diacylglycerol kinase family lipid kinase [Legionella israelensis]|uniref:diacylglycerol/lipid kinase family protein n=1 Tax=Legionella israelensis TaxID=454 RepID=UPI00117D2406|nr:diacylglycerol kinase family protein [Legionella israelensis]QDP72229.1 diacylglycerol kinase family lipid kinase [Legionella israelensis]
MSRKIAVVINPIAGKGKGRKIWQAMSAGLHALFDNVDYRMSNHVDDIKLLTQSLLEEKPDYLLVIGGDGTLSSALNGLISTDKWRVSKTLLAYFNAGSGGDYARQFPIQRVTEFLDRLKHHQQINTNVGKIVFANESVHYFINVASCGFSAYVAQLTQKSTWLKKLGGRVNYFLHALMGLMKYSQTRVRVSIDNYFSREFNLLLMAVCNGQYFGGQMHVAPMAKVDDALLDVAIFHDFNKSSAVLKLRKIYSGKHILEPNVHYLQAKKVRIESLDSKPLFVEADGELVGQTPVSFELLNHPVGIIL